MGEVQRAQAGRTDGKGFFYSRFPEPKKGAAFQSAQRQHEALLPHARHAAERGRARLRAARQPEVGHRRRRHRGRPLPRHHRRRRDHQPQGADRLQGPARTATACRSISIDDFDNKFFFVDNDGPVFYFQTDYQAPKARSSPSTRASRSEKNWKTIDPGGEGNARKRRSGRQPLHLHLPEGCEDAGQGLRPRRASSSATSSCPASAPRRLRRQARATPRPSTPSPASPRRRASIATTSLTGKSKLFRQAKVKFDPDDYESKQVFYTSKDGTKVPMFITSQEGPQARRRTTRRCSTATAGSTSRSRRASRCRACRGWRWAASTRVANLRGGGEYGEDWHQAGTKLKKQNVFDDFIAAAEWLIEEKYTSAEQAGDPGRQQRRPAGRRRA